MSETFVLFKSRCFVTMASSTETESDDDSVFYDANSSLATADALTPLQNEPRWRVSSKTTPLQHQSTERFLTISLTENQIEEIERRDKLQRLRYQEKVDLTPPKTSLTPDLIKDHFEADRTKKFSKETPNSNDVDLNLIDRITRYGAVSPTSEILGDDEILRQPIVRNLDNGKYIPLSDANPMTKTILERVQQSGGTSTNSRRNSLFKNHNFRKNSSELNNENLLRLNQIDGEQNSTSSSEASSQNTAISSTKSSKSADGSSTSVLGGGKRQIKNLITRTLFRRTKTKKTIEIDDDDDAFERVLINDGSNGDLKYKASRHIRDQTHFDKTQLLQTIGRAHDGPIWSMRFSPDGYLLATGGQDCLLKVWLLKCARPHFDDFSRLTNNASKQQNEILNKRLKEFHQKIVEDNSTSTINMRLGLTENQAPIYPKAFCEFVGHQAPVLDVAWSKSLFLLSSSMDKTVRLWHLSRSECLCFFRHVDFVSAIAFHPRDDRYFVSASLDGHVRLWNIPDKRVVYWTLIPSQVSSQITAAQANLITAVNFCDDGRKVNVGTFDGRFLLYTDSLQYDTVMNIGEKDASRTHRSRKTAKGKPRKITGIESMNTNNSKVLITSNDSRIRLYNIRTRQIEQKYRGYSNQSSQIRATFSHDDQFIISGSEDRWFYIWKSESDSFDDAFSSSRKQRENFDRAFERIQVHNAMVTSAIFAPNPLTIMEYFYQSNESTRQRSSVETSSSTYVMVTADSKGQLKLLVNRLHR